MLGPADSDLKRIISRSICLTLAAALGTGASAIANEPGGGLPAFEIVSRTQSEKEPPVHMACYSRLMGPEMIGPSGISPDGGRTWKLFNSTPDFAANLPLGFRRATFPSVLDPSSARLVNVYNALDTPGLDPTIAEPKMALHSYYLRYRVST